MESLQTPRQAPHHLVGIYGSKKYPKLKFYEKVQVPESELINMMKEKRAKAIPIVLLLGLFKDTLMGCIVELADEGTRLEIKMHKLWFSKQDMVIVNCSWKVHGPYAQ